jgi:uncharacterized protein YqjF (DUF2071 family)
MDMAMLFNRSKLVGSDRIFLTANWQHVVMLNYEADPDLLASLVPEGTELDRWNGKSFVSIVGFRFLQTRLFGFPPVPMHANSDEVNLRFYVRRRTEDEVRRGVVFVREIVPRRAIAFIARTFYNEKYVARPMTHEISPDVEDRMRVAYRWRSEERWNQIGVETQGSPEIPMDGSVEQFITEHYWGYAAQRDGGCVEYRVSHPSWKVWQVRRAGFDGDVESIYGKEFASTFRAGPQTAFLAEGSPVTVMRGHRL